MRGEISINILAIGDLVGEQGLKKLEDNIEKIVKENNIDFIIVNAENVADGSGITQKLFDRIIKIGTNVVTMGNHTWGKRDIFAFIDDPKLIRPANYPEGVCGKGFGIYNSKGKKIAVINLIGRTGMNVQSENPFIIAKKIIDEIREKVDIIVVDFHAEATAEKIAMGRYLDGKADIVFGTHTHVQTADETILPEGTAYITDIGMTGPIESVIGMDIEASLKRFLTTIPERYKVAKGESKLDGCIFEVDDEKCRTTTITRINL